MSGQVELIHLANSVEQSIYIYIQAYTVCILYVSATPVANMKKIKTFALLNSLRLIWRLHP